MTSSDGLGLERELGGDLNIPNDGTGNVAACGGDASGTPASYCLLGVS